MIRDLALLLCVCLLFSACGRKTPVKPPELAAPEQISDLRANNHKGGIRLAWKRPQVYADGSKMNDLGGFRLQRATPGGPFARLTELRLDDQERFRQTKQLRFLDDTAETDVEYRYRVLSFTLDEYVSKPSNEVTILRAVPAPAAETAEGHD